MIVTNKSNLNFDSVLPDGQTVPGTTESNVVQTEILTYSFTKVKTTAKDFVKEGETLTQGITYTNNSGIAVTNLFFNDTLGDGATHVPQSVYINNINYPGYDLVAGFPLPDMQPGDVVNVGYTVLANNPKTQEFVANFGTLKYDVNDPIQGPTTYSENTNTVNFAVFSTRFNVVKSVNKATAIKGETLHYTSTITNSGSVTTKNIVFSDPLQSDITFVPGSVKVDGIVYPTYNPNISFQLTDLAPGEQHIVEFDATVN